jgi:hypothetical protein
MIYDNPKIESNKSRGQTSPPFITHIMDQDHEILELEYNLDGLVIVRVVEQGGSSPCMPIIKLINALLELNEEGMKHEKQFDGFDAS